MTVNSARGRTSSSAGSDPDDERLGPDRDPWDDDEFPTTRQRRGSFDPDMDRSDTFGDSGRDTFGDTGSSTFGDSGSDTFGDSSSDTFGDSGSDTFGDGGGFDEYGFSDSVNSKACGCYPKKEDLLDMDLLAQHLFDLLKREAYLERERIGVV